MFLRHVLKVQPGDVEKHVKLMVGDTFDDKTIVQRFAKGSVRFPPARRPRNALRQRLNVQPFDVAKLRHGGAVVVVVVVIGVVVLVVGVVVVVVVGGGTQQGTA